MITHTIHINVNRNLLAILCIDLHAIASAPWQAIWIFDIMEKFKQSGYVPFPPPFAIVSQNITCIKDVIGLLLKVISPQNSQIDQNTWLLLPLKFALSVNIMFFYMSCPLCMPSVHSCLLCPASEPDMDCLIWPLVVHRLQSSRLRAYQHFIT